ncbi:unnamed protein product [Macrosiphum euphorbiae]|uniref:Uncharacterized protein n=1 Tax=Macrosiphum euphorbiae TaxID=13131 RepID=A0AAV0XCJ7_9HEMI|nr:unnamed protein product [Macrosiphum euphorbiae]
MLEYSHKHQRKLKPNAVPSKNLPRIQKPTIKCKPVNTHTPHSTHDSQFQSSFQSSKVPKEKIDPFTSNNNNNNNCLNDLHDFGVQLLRDTQDVGIQCEIGMVYSRLPVERADVSIQCAGDDLNEVEKYEQNTNNC